MRTGISAGSTCCSITARAATDRRYTHSMRPRRQTPSDTLADNKLQKQRFLTNEKRLQQQEEDEWMQYMQAEADVDPRNQYWADHAQNKTAATSQRPSKQPQQLGTTRLGRQRLQQKTDSFADMVHLVAAADEKAADATDRPEASSVRATRAATNAAATSHGTTHRGSHSNSAASTSHMAADQSHLHRLQDGSTAAPRSHPDYEPAEPLEVAGHANATAAAAPESNAELSLTSMDHGPVEYRNGQVHGSSSATAAHMQEGSARAKHLQRLEAAAAKWRQRSDCNNSMLANQPHALDRYGVSPQTATPSGGMTNSQEAQSWPPQRALDSVESNSFVPQSAEVGVAERPENDGQQSAFESSAGVPPPPSRPPKISLAKTKASWLDALKGDAPPGLL